MSVCLWKFGPLRSGPTGLRPDVATAFKEGGGNIQEGARHVAEEMRAGRDAKTAQLHASGAGGGAGRGGLLVPDLSHESAAFHLIPRKKEAPATLGRSQFGNGGFALRAAAEGMPSARALTRPLEFGVGEGRICIYFKDHPAQGR